MTLRAALRSVVLSGATDFDGFRDAARGLLQAGVPPQAVVWHTADSAASDLFESSGSDEPASAIAWRAPMVQSRIDEAAHGAEADAPLPDTAPHVSGTDVVETAGPHLDVSFETNAAAAVSRREPITRPHVPAEFLALCRTVVLHADPGRFALLYRLLCRLQGEPGLRHDPLDADRVQARHLAQAVRRDLHKMKAFVRFRRLADAQAAAGAHADDPLHVAWFEPSHHIVEAVAPFFMRRFTAMRWAILTPERCVRWDGTRLQFGPGARRDEALPADAGEALWLTYYQHIFNPARLKLAMMQKEMPRKYWHNLPEATLISGLAAQAAPRMAGMVAQGGTAPARRIPIAVAGARVAALADADDRDDLHDELRDARAGLAPRTEASRLTLADLKPATDRCRDCPIGEHATQAVCGEGPAHAKLMVVGEQPGDREDLQGRPFVGPAGQLFDRAMRTLGLSRDAVFVTNAVKHFKYELRGQRRIHKTPAQQEAAACLQWLEREIDLVQPQGFVALGATAARALLGRAVAVTRERGQWLARDDGRPVLVTLHPSALLRLPDGDREAAYQAWLQDLALASKHVDR